MTQMADDHLGLDLNDPQPFRLVSNGQWWTFETNDVTLVYTLNPELMHRSIITDVEIYQSHILLWICICSNNF